MHQRKKEKFSIKKLLKELIFGSLVGLAVGLIISAVFISLQIDIKQMSFGHFMILFAVASVLSVPIHVILHELGHVFFGLIAGFKLRFITIFGLTWTKNEKGIATAKVWNPFALGQAGMTPKDERPKWAYALYLLGGVLFNVLWGLVFIGISIFNENIYLRIFLIIIAIVGIVIGLFNLWPIDQSDGMHLKRLWQEDSYHHELQQTLEYLDAMLDATDFSDLKPWMEIDSQAPLTSLNNLNAIVLQATQAACQGDFTRAGRIYRAIFEKKQDLNKIQQIEIMQEYLFALLMSDPNHKHVYQIKKDPLMQNFWETRTPTNYRMRAADAFYMRFEREKASELLATGAPLIARLLIPFDQQIERRMYDLVEERIENDSLEDLKLLPREELMGMVTKKKSGGDNQDE